MVHSVLAVGIPLPSAPRGVHGRMIDCTAFRNQTVIARKAVLKAGLTGASVMFCEKRYRAAPPNA